MGWWETGLADDVTGDEPADIVTTTLRDIAASHRKRRRRKPPLPALLNALIRELRQRPQKYLSGRRVPIKRIVAKGKRRGKAVEYVSNLRADDDKANELEAPLRKALEAIATAYEQAVDRKPRLSEVLASFAFALGDEPEEYFSDAAGVSIDKIEAK